MKSHTAAQGSTIGGIETLRVLSINHRAHGFANLSRLVAHVASAEGLHETLGSLGIESVPLSTCNRCEVYWRARGPQDDVAVTRVLEETFGIEAGELAARSTLLSGASVARYLFRVCAGLESAVLGEAEILGQVRAALDASPHAGSFLRGVFRAALRAGGAARAETAIGEGALSVASTGIHWLADQIPLNDRRVLILGAGHTARKAARHLKALGVKSLVIANRTKSRAEALASTLSADVVEFDRLNEVLPEVDAVVSAVSVREWVIKREHLQGRPAARPLAVVDLSMPPSIEPHPVPGVIHVDLTLLDKASEVNRRRREAEAPKVEAVIARELEHFERWARREALRPVLARRRQEIDAIRRSELELARTQLHSAEDPAEVLERFSRRLLDRMFSHDPGSLEGIEA
jgi:glutamyl-tRNA reductase